MKWEKCCKLSLIKKAVQWGGYVGKIGNEQLVGDTHTKEKLLLLESSWVLYVFEPSGVCLCFMELVRRDGKAVGFYFRCNPVAFLQLQRKAELIERWEHILSIPNVLVIVFWRRFAISSTYTRWNFYEYLLRLVSRAHWNVLDSLISPKSIRLIQYVPSWLVKIVLFLFSSPTCKHLFIASVGV